MDRPRLFVSSTMRMLTDLRAALKEELEAHGYEFRLDDRAPVLTPGLTLLEQCLAEVQKAHILILVLDRHYGTEVDGQWFVREEFHHAQHLGKISYVFVRDALEAISETPPKKGRGAKNHGVHPGVLELLTEIKVGHRLWIQPFRDVSDLKDKLIKQLSGLFAQLLETRSQAGLIRLSHLLEKMNYDYRQGNFVQAVLTCEEILQQDPENVDALLSRAVCRIRIHGLSHKQSIRDGIADCEKVLRFEPKHFRARYNLANFHVLSPEHKPEQVEVELRQLFEDFPEYAFYFERDKEFKQNLSLRKMWS